VEACPNIFHAETIERLLATSGVPQVWKMQMFFPFSRVGCYTHAEQREVAFWAFFVKGH
jgi:hypothetical protein